MSDLQHTNNRFRFIDHKCTQIEMSTHEFSYIDKCTNPKRYLIPVIKQCIISNMKLHKHFIYR